MSIVGFSPELQADIFRILAAILHLGNVTFQSNPDDSSSVSSKKYLDTAASILRVSSSELEETLTHLIVKTGKDSIKKANSLTKAEGTRETVSKALYGKLFSWIVSSINASMQVRKNVEAITDDHSVGVLDIFGFEVVQA